MASGWNLWVWLVSVVVRRYIIDILIIIITFPYSTCISSSFGSIIPISLFIFKMFFRSFYIHVRIIISKDLKRSSTILLHTFLSLPLCGLIFHS